MNITPNMVRRNATVRDGIIHWEGQGSDVSMVDYQPNNGTRYVLLLSEMDKLKSRNGWPKASVLVTLMTEPNDERSAFFIMGDPVEWEDVEKRLKLRTVDAMAVSEVLAFLLDAPALSLENMCARAPKSRGPNYCTACGGDGYAIDAPVCPACNGRG